MRRGRSPFLRSVELKLERANAQLRSLETSIADWVASNPIAVECRLREGRLGYQLVVKELGGAAPLEEWGLVFGECIHNLRSALDNLAYALARIGCDPPKKPNLVSFPIFSDQVAFEKRGRRNIEQVGDEAAALIEKIQPFNRDGSPGNGTPDQDALVLLQWFSNTDKHRVPAVVLIAQTNVRHEVTIEFLSEADAAESVPPDTIVHAGALSTGVVLLEHKTRSPIASVKGGYKVEAIVAIETPNQPAAIPPTLHTLSYYVALVVSQFQGFFQ
jgi:hypothetical protein